MREFLGSDRETAERAVRSVLSVLGERLGADEGLVYAQHLPPELGALLHTDSGARSFDAEIFLLLVADRESTDLDTAERHTLAVLAALARAVPDQEWDHLLVRLSKDYAPLLPKGPVPAVMPTRTFLAKIAERAGVDTADALTAAQAVLETLAERIATGEAYDLTTRLPVRVHSAVKRGVAQADERTRRMVPDDFLRRVAQRTGVSEKQARDYTRAVLATVREATREQFLDVQVQLPDGYGDLLDVR